MKLLLDESIPRKLRFGLADHEVRTVPACRWSGKKNGELLRLDNGQFDVLITMDRNLEHQQNLSGLDLAVAVLIAPSNRLADIAPLVPELLKELARVRPGTVVHVTRSEGAI